MINLFERDTEDSRLLLASLRQAGYDHPTVFLEETGYLPQGVTSPYAFFLAQAGAKLAGKPLFFNQVPVPAYWEIKGSLSQAEVANHNQRVATISYDQTRGQERLVAKVAWQDANGKVRLVDYYNQYGWCFKHSYYDETGRELRATYQTDQGVEVISEDKLTQTISLTYHKQQYFFKNLVDFTIFFLKEAGYKLDQIWYNSLSTPMFVATRLGVTGVDILFWQEGKRDEVPGNMDYILHSNPQRPTKICVTDKEAYAGFADLFSPADQDSLAYIGYLYNYRRENQARKQALIMTNSDQIAHLQELVEQLPNLTFHIAALTEMSPKLMAFAAYDNVKLYPNVNPTQVSQLWQLADYYLDINYQDEILRATKQAFLNQMLILGFNETSHTNKFGLAENRFPVTAYQDLIAKLDQLLAHDEEVSKEVFLQKQAAEQTSVAYYHKVLG